MVKLVVKDSERQQPRKCLKLLFVVLMTHASQRTRYKTDWPELVGSRGHHCKVTIERDNPTVTVIFVPPPGYMDRDFCCNRVYVFLDDNGICLFAPKIG
ncbi:hypothetical protein OROGR_014808 [Orobanche gracilis]